MTEDERVEALQARLAVRIRCEAQCSRCWLREVKLCGFQPEEQERRIQRGLVRDRNGLRHYVPTPARRGEKNGA